MKFQMTPLEAVTKIMSEVKWHLKINTQVILCLKYPGELKSESSLDNDIPPSSYQFQPISEVDVPMINAVGSPIPLLFILIGCLSIGISVLQAITRREQRFRRFSIICHSEWFKTSRGCTTCRCFIFESSHDQSIGCGASIDKKSM